MKKLFIAIALAVAAMELFSGCSSLKQMAPNTWNVTAPVDQTGRSQGVWFGVGGALPWGKQ